MADAIATGATISAVTFSEVATVLVRHDSDPETILAPVRDQVEVRSFTDEGALAAAALYPRTAAIGLSLGDRACLALARRLGRTADRACLELTPDIDVQPIR